MNRILTTREAIEEIEKGSAPKGGDRHNEGKPPLWLLPWSALRLRIPTKRQEAAYALWLWARRDSNLCFPNRLKSEGVLEGASFILEFGITKYAAFNWEKGLSFIATVSSGLRHAVATGETDPESGKPHLQHLHCNLLFAAHFDSDPEIYGKFDDRPEAAK